MTAMFDTLKFARTLRDGGSFSPDQAERLSDAIADALSGEVVARADLATTESSLRKAIEDARAELKGDIADLRSEMAELRAEQRRDIADLRADLRAETADRRADMRSLETRIEAAKAETIKWVVGLFGLQIVALLGGLIALARLLPR